MFQEGYGGLLPTPKGATVCFCSRKCFMCSPQRYTRCYSMCWTDLREHTLKSPTSPPPQPDERKRVSCSRPLRAAANRTPPPPPHMDPAPSSAVARHSTAFKSHITISEVFPAPSEQFHGRRLVAGSLADSMGDSEDDAQHEASGGNFEGRAALPIVAPLLTCNAQKHSPVTSRPPACMLIFLTLATLMYEERTGETFHSFIPQPKLPRLWNETDRVLTVSLRHFREDFDATARCVLRFLSQAPCCSWGTSLHGYGCWSVSFCSRLFLQRRICFANPCRKGEADCMAATQRLVFGYEII